MSELWRFVYIGSHVTVHAKLDAQKVNCNLCFPFLNLTQIFDRGEETLTMSFFLVSCLFICLFVLFFVKYSFNTLRPPYALC